MKFYCKFLTVSLALCLVACLPVRSVNTVAKTSKSAKFVRGKSAASEYKPTSVIKDTHNDKISVRKIKDSIDVTTNILKMLSEQQERSENQQK
jgi:hypothetical protein